jgi:hypothetical protein
MLYTYCLILLYTTTTSSSGWYKRHIVYCIDLDGLPATYTSYCMCDDCDVFFGSTHFPPLFWSKHSIVCATSFRKTARVGWETWREKKISDTKNKTGTSSCCLFVRVTGWYDKSKVDILWSYINYQYRLIPKLLIEIQTKVWKCFFFFLFPLRFQIILFYSSISPFEKEEYFVLFQLFEKPKTQKGIEKKFQTARGPANWIPL